jgi:hypothetical protein
MIRLIIIIIVHLVYGKDDNYNKMILKIMELDEGKALALNSNEIVDVVS